MKALSARRRSKGGRPRKTGERHACGKLIQADAPNAKVVALRQALLGPAPRGQADLAAAESPMGLALARGWITEAQHRAGVAYARAWRRSHPQRRVTTHLTEVPGDPAARDRRKLAELSDAELTAAFDAVLDATDRRPPETTELEARTRYNALSRAMTAAEQAEVFACFCLESWPQWIVQRCAGNFDTAWERKRRLLVAGLEAIG